MTEAAHRKSALLYVDDEPQALKYFARMFEDEFRVLTAGTTTEARQILRLHADEIGVVITDQRMPGETGVSLLEYFRSRHPAAVRILTTAYTDLQSAVDAVNAGGAYQYVEKPWDFNSLRITLRRAVERFDLERERDQLLAQKASAVQASFAVDRTRTIAAVAAAFGADFHGALSGARDYLRAARRAGANAFAPRDFSDADLWSDATTEGHRVVAAVASIAAQLRDLRTPEEAEPLAACLRQAADEVNVALKQQGVTADLQASDEHEFVVQRPARFRCLIRILVSRLSDVDGEPLRIRIGVASAGGETNVTMSAEERAWTVELAAALYSLGLNRRGGLMGQDMDLFAAHLLAADAGASLHAPRPGESPAAFSLSLRSDALASRELATDELFTEAVEATEQLAVPTAD